MTRTVRCEISLVFTVTSLVMMVVVAGRRIDLGGQVAVQRKLAT